MKTSCVVLTFLLILAPNACITADVVPKQDAPNAILWEPKAGVIDIASTLLTTTQNGKTISQIKIYIKNISNSRLDLVVPSRTDQGFKIFIIDGNGAKHSLHNLSGEKETRIQKIAASMGSVFLQHIDSSATVERTIDLSPAEFSLIKNSKLKIEFSLVNSQTGQTYPLEFSPKQLVETVNDK